MSGLSRAIGIAAGVLGACGIGALAASTHAYPARNLDIAGYMLLIHAAVLVAIAQKTGRSLAVAGAVMIIGTVLFSGDLALRAIAEIRPFPMAAPTGGVVLIVGWLAVAVGFAFRRSSSDDSRWRRSTRSRKSSSRRETDRE